MNGTTNGIQSVEDIEKSKLTFGVYDLVLFACGSEPRCVHIAEQINGKKQEKVSFVVLRIASADDVAAQKNEKLFRDLGYETFVSMGVDDSQKVYQFLDKELSHIEKENPDSRAVSIFVDYSSMPREWYASLLNWCCAQSTRNLTVDFGYSLGLYGDDWEKKECVELRNIGDGGGVSSVTYDNEGTVVIGLGLDEDAPYTVQSGLDIKKAIAFISSPSVTEDVEKRVWEVNRDFIEEFCSTYPLLMFPVNAVTEVFQCLSEIAAMRHISSTVVLAPLGPKPQVLASLLVMHKYNNTVCIKVGHKHERRYEVQASGETVFTRVSIGAVE